MIKVVCGRGGAVAAGPASCTAQSNCPAAAADYSDPRMSPALAKRRPWTRNALHEGGYICSDSPHRGMGDKVAKGRQWLRNSKFVARRRREERMQLNDDLRSADLSDPPHLGGRTTETDFQRRRMQY